MTGTDLTTAQDTYEALVGFFKLFPQFADRDFYIAGESYAGVYIPMIIEQIEENITAAGDVRRHHGLQLPTVS